MTTRRKYCLMAIVIVLSAAAFLFGSYIRARSVAHSVMLPILNDWGYYETRFIPWDYSGQSIGPIWCVRYDAIERLVLQPLDVEVSLIGKVIRTNPRNLQEEIKADSQK